MTDQLNLRLDPPDPPYQKHSETSKAAAIAIKPHVGPMHKLILNYLRNCASRGATDEKMQSALEMAANTQRPRRRELQLAKLIEKSGTKRKTSSGRAAVVWVLARPE